MARSKFSSSGRSGTSSDGNYEPKVDRDPFYRTLAIFNSLFKKKFKLEQGTQNATDCKEKIYVNFGETMFSSIVGFSRSSEKDGKSIYTLACGHEWEGNAGHALDGSKSGACWKCGSHQAYLGFEHEWQHIIFKSDIPAQFLFCEGYTDQLSKMAPHVDKGEINAFLKLLVNAFDDIRCNSLWEKIYPGSADQIWKRWQRLARKLQSKDDNFLTFIFAVAFSVPTNPNGPFEHLRPVVEWAVSKVKYRGFANMLVQVRVVIEHCMAAVLATMPPALPPPPPLPPQPAPQQDHQDDPSSGNQGTGDSSDQPSDASQGDDDGKSGGDPTGSSDGGVASGQAPDSGGQGGGQEHQPTSSDQDPSASQVSHPSVGTGTGPDPSKALQTLLAGASALDEKEKHLGPDFVDINKAKTSQSMGAMIAKILSDDVTDLQDIDQRMPTGVPDRDMQTAIDFVTKALEEQQSLDSQLTNDAKARVTIIDVPPEGIPPSSVVVLETETKLHIARMRAAFFKAMGKKKAQRSSEGTEIDVQAYIQYKLDRQDPDVFLTEEVQQGFSYSIVCDMSGSMSGTFPQVAQAAEMLRESLDFPFVHGDVWGFRGGEGFSSDKHAGEVWLYRYSPHVRGYIGKGYSQNARGRWEYPVRCGGITPMNTAINITARHQHRCVSEGMAKRMFLLTDGSPLQTRISGGQISPEVLKKFVANEIRKARNRGIQVYTMVIGEHAIPEEDCLKMFGPRKFWRRVANKDVGRELSNLVIDNFQKYLSNKS